MLKQLLKLYNANKFVFFLQILDKLFFFILFWFIAYLFSVNEYGNVIVSFSVSNILFYILQFGIPIYLQNKSAKSEKINFRDIVISIHYGLFIFLISNFMILFIMKLLYGDYSTQLLLINSFVFSYYFISIFNSLLLGRREHKYQFKVFLFVRLILILLLTSLFLLSSDLFFIILACFIGNVVISLILYFRVINEYYTERIKFNYDYSEYKSLLYTSLPIGLASIINFLYDKIDTIIISKILNVDQAAYYNISYGVYKTSHLLFSFILIAGFTRVSYLSKRISAVSIFLKKYYKYLFSLSIIISVLLLLLSETLIIGLYGEKYRSSILLLQMLSISVFPLALNNLTGITLNGLGLYKTNLKIVIAALVINLTFNFMLLNCIGVIGAVLTTFITEVFIFISGFIILRRLLI